MEITTTRCPRCNGNVVKDEDGDHCLLCGRTRTHAAIMRMPELPPRPKVVETMTCFMCHTTVNKHRDLEWMPESSHFGRSRWYHNTVSHHGVLLVDFYVCPECQGRSVRGRSAVGVGMKLVWAKVNEKVRELRTMLEAAPEFHSQK